MPRKHLRSIASSYQTEDRKADPVDLGSEVANNEFDNYDPDAHFHSRATDYHGHSKNLQVNIPTTWGTAVSKIIDSPRTPYKSAVEMCRDYIIHGMVRELQAMAEDGSDVPTFWFAQAHLEARRWEIEGQRQYLDELNEYGELFVRAGDWASMLSLMWQAEHVPLSGHHKAKRDEIVRKYRAQIPKNYHPSYDTE